MEDCAIGVRMHNFLAFLVVLPYGASLLEGRIGRLVNRAVVFSNLVKEHH
jgi:hypothetical protein